MLTEEGINDHTYGLCNIYVQCTPGKIKFWQRTRFLYPQMQGMDDAFSPCGLFDGYLGSVQYQYA